MVPNVHKLIKLLFVCLVVTNSGYSQIKKVENAAIEKFLNPVFWKYQEQGIPEIELCSDYTTLIFHVRNNKMLDSFNMTRAPQHLKTSLGVVIPYYKKANWRKLLPTKSANYDVVQQVAYRYVDYRLCPDTIPDEKLEQMKIEDLKMRKDTMIPTYVLKLVKIINFAPVY
ncbi:MAG: hypothetical protein J7623_13365 [Chitinophaga sp.]|uniref:hypothetical protein n=1 Tax=Chitinophaga sp. TaxID=1869181 RepID=UPI001AFFAB2D|nr:hypothetical protein [Chitinophaga sp.]MBO9729620.1 hypothetical protein [Chitinophaga sp.]